MTTIFSVKNLQEHFFVPIFFKYQNDRMLTLQIKFTDFIGSTVFSETVTLKAWPDSNSLLLSFKQLEQFLDNIGSVAIETLCSNVYQASNIYKNSIHKVDIIATGNNKTITTTRYFTIPSIVVQANSNNNLAQIQMNIPSANCYAFIGDSNIVSIDTALIANCTFSDTIIYSTTYTENLKSVRQNINVANYEMSEIIFYVIATYSDFSKQLLGLTTLGQTEILIPQVKIIKGNTQLNSDKTRRRIEGSLEITSKSFNGIDWIDKGSMFYSKGLMFSMDGKNNPSIEISKLIGA